MAKLPRKAGTRKNGGGMGRGEHIMDWTNTPMERKNLLKISDATTLPRATFGE